MLATIRYIKHCLTYSFILGRVKSCLNKKKTIVVTNVVIPFIKFTIPYCNTRFLKSSFLQNTSIIWTIDGIENKSFGMYSKTSISNATAISSQFVVYSSLILLCHPCHFFLSFLVVFLQPQEILTSPFTLIEHICMIKISTLVEFEAS